MILLSGYLIEKDLLHNFSEYINHVAQDKENNHPNVQLAADALKKEIQEAIILI